MSTIVNLALLETLKANEFKDEIDLYIPFLAVTITNIKDIPFDISVVRRQLKNKFGFSPPEAVVKVLLSRAKKNKLVRVEKYQYLPITDNLKPYKDSYDKKKIELEESLADLTSDFSTYVKNKFDLVIESDRSEIMLLNFIKSNIVGLLSTIKDKAGEEIKNPKHLVASYIANISRVNKPLFSMLEIVVKGMVLANYLLFADRNEGDSKKKDFSNITVYLDTPLLISLLELSGKTSKNATEELISLLRELKISLKVFDKTLAELEGLFYAWKRDLESGNEAAFNPKTLELLKIKGFDGPRLESEITLIEDNLSKFGIEIQRGFKFSEKHLCDEEALNTMLMDKLGRGSKDKMRIEHDSTCISRIHNLRLGRVIPQLNKELTVFCTPNNGLIKTVNNFFSNETSKGIPLLVSDSWLTTIFWLKSGDAFNHLPMHSLLANAFATLNTSSKIWDGFKSKLNGMIEREEITHEQYDRIRFDTKLLHEVYDASVKVGDEFENEHVFDIIDKITNMHEEKKNNELNKLKEDERRKYAELEAEHAKSVEKTKENEQIKHSELVDKHAMSEKKLKEEGLIKYSELEVRHAGFEARINRIDDIILKSSKLISFVFVAVTLFSFLLVTFFSLPFFEPLPDWISSSAIYGIAVAFTLVLAVLAALFGWGLTDLHGWVTAFIYKKIKKYTIGDIGLKKRVEPNIDENVET